MKFFKVKHLRCKATSPRRLYVKKKTDPASRDGETSQSRFKKIKKLSTFRSCSAFMGNQRSHTRRIVTAARQIQRVSPIPLDTSGISRPIETRDSFLQPGMSVSIAETSASNHNMTITVAPSTRTEGRRQPSSESEDDSDSESDDVSSSEAPVPLISRPTEMRHALPQREVSVSIAETLTSNRNKTITVTPSTHFEGRRQPSSESEDDSDFEFEAPMPLVLTLTGRYRPLYRRNCFIQLLSVLTRVFPAVKCDRDKQIDMSACKHN